MNGDTVRDYVAERGAFKLAKSSTLQQWIASWRLGFGVRCDPNVETLLTASSATGSATTKGLQHAIVGVNPSNQ